jgi:hypothetical protein
MCSGMKKLITFFAGIAGGVAFVFSCQHMTTAGAAPSDCATWQVGTLTSPPFADPTYVASYQISDGKTPPSPYPFQFTFADFPTGWEPFAAVGNGWAIRRCKP